MSSATHHSAARDEQVARLHDRLQALDALADPAARSAARELVQAVIELHGAGLGELLSIVDEAGTQPADTLLPKFVANPGVSNLLLLHDLHPQDMATRVRQAVERLRPVLGVRGVRADLAGVDERGVVRINVTASGQKTQRPPVAELRRDIEDAVLAAAPDTTDLLIDGLETTGNAHEAYVPLSSITRRDATNGKVAATGK